MQFVGPCCPSQIACEPRAAAEEKITGKSVNPFNKKSNYYKPFTNVRLPDHNSLEILLKKFHEFEAELLSTFPEFPCYPASAKIALMDMIYNLGAANLKTKFPKFTTAARIRDWKEAAKESKRTGISDDRNTETRRLLLQAAEAEDKAARDNA